MNDTSYDIGGGAPPNGMKVKDPMWYLKLNSSNFIPTHMVTSIKNARFKLQPSTLMQSFVTMRCILFQLVSTHLIGITPFMEIDDKGGEVGTKI